MVRAVFTVLLALTALVASAQRIITAGSALTETVCALGACSQIIASDKTSLFPPDIQRLPSIGYRTNISAEGIIALQPTLFFAEKDYVEPVVLSQIRGAGIQVIDIERPVSFEGTRALIARIATVLGKEKEGLALIQKISRELEEARAIASRSGQTPKVLCVFNRDKATLSMGGARTFADILPLVGAVSAIHGVDGYKPLNTESLIASNPDYLLMFETGVQSLGGMNGVLQVPGVLQTTAGQKKQIIAMEGIKLSNFGPRLGEAAKELAARLHGNSSH